jgi:hypothetical protein
MRRRIHVICGGGYMSYEEEDTCHMGTFRPLISPASLVACVICGGGYLSLRVVEVGWHGDDGVLDFLAKIGLSCFLHFADDVTICMMM